MKENNFEQILTEELDSLKKKGMEFFVFKLDKYSQASEFMLKHLTKDLKASGIYICTERTYDDFEILEDGKIDERKIYFILRKGSRTAKNRNLYELSRPGSLVELSLAINSAINTGKYDFLFFDSFSNLLINNGTPAIEKFSQFLSSKLRDQGVEGFILTTDGDGTSQIAPQIYKFADKFIIL